MKKLILFFLCLACSILSYAQKNIRVPVNMLLQIQIPIQPDDKSWIHWNEISNPNDSTQTFRIDRRISGYAPFIPHTDAPYYAESQVTEIKLALEKLLNPDGYFASQDEFMVFTRAFLDKFVFRKKGIEK